MQGAIKTARYGFPVTADLVRYMASATSGAPTNFLVDDPNWAKDFAPNGTLVRLNDIMTRQRYASTLEAIAEHGPDAFYTGPIAEATIETLQAANGTMTMDDLKNYNVAIREPAEINYRGYKLTSVSAPASGGVVLAIMKIVEGYETMGDAAYLNLSTHHLDEATRFGYGMRTSLGDPLFVKGMDEYQHEILNETTAKVIRSRISDTHTLNASAYDPKNLEVLNTPGTSHVVTADSSGMAISLTTTVNLLFGSQLIVPSTGVIMNNEMNDFSIPGTKNAFGLEPSESNFVRPGKRPVSSIACTIAEYPDGSLYFVTGSAGGSRIITATLQTLWHVLDQNMTSAQALKAPRLHDQLSPNIVSFEYAYDNATVDYMKSLGHNVTWVAPGQSTAQCLRVLADGTFEAASEPRQLNSGAYVV
jgi:gamma-glutamyltranspeptidase/glutathione hydrolase